MGFRKFSLAGLGLNNWQNKKVLVTGATGLVGSFLVKTLLDSKAHVICLVRDWDPQSELIRSGLIKNTNVVSGELEDFSTVERAIVEHEVDTVFHLGAQTIVGHAFRSPRATFDTNIRGTYNLLDACRIHSDLVTSVVIASSDKSYGDVSELPYDETMPQKGRHPYDVSKSCTDLLASTYAHTYGVPLAIMRCGNIYGPGDLNYSRIIPGTIRSLYHHQAPVLRSNGLFLRDYVYVDDAVKAYLTLAENITSPLVKGEAFNFGPAEPKTVLEVVTAIQILMGRSNIQPIIQDVAHAEIRDQFLDSSKAWRVLGLKPSRTLEEGLVETVTWYENRLQVAA